MKQLIKITYISIAMLLAQSCFAQYVPVKIKKSTEIVNIKGTLFYLHEVEEKQTLYSIAKVYNTDIESIIKNNPSLSSGLKKGTIIYIKVEDIKVEDKQEESKQIEREQEKTIQVEDIKIEQKPVITTDTLTQFQAQHVVKWYESLSSIAKKHGVSEEEIAHANSLIKNKVETRQVLNIPFPGSYSFFEESHKSDSLNRGEIYDKNLNREKERQKQELFKRTKYDKLTISLLLPLGGPHNLAQQKDLKDPDNFM
ncbi:MAG: LysM peptidoglycan-binding domain-containing protein, partial [Bacteroidales bacterium]